MEVDMRIWHWVLVLASVAFPVHAADLGSPEKRAHAAPVYSAPERNLFAAIAVSVDVRKDAYGFQYEKDSSSGAEADALRFCEERFAKKGISGGRCTVRSGTAYVIGIYCRDARSPAGIGTGVTPTEAAQDALSQVHRANLRRCDFKQMRHGSIDKREIEQRVWVSGVRCRGADFASKASGAIVSLNAVLSYCGDVSAGSVRILGVNQH